MRSKTCRNGAFAPAAMLALALMRTAQAQTLTGRALMHAASLAGGPTSGPFAGSNPYGTNQRQFVKRHALQGLSGV